MKNNRLLFVVVMVATLLLAACAPSASQIATAIAQTQAAMPTPTILPTNTPLPTYTPLPTATPLPTITSTPVPATVVEVIEDLGFTQVPGFSCSDQACNAYDNNSLGMRVIIVPGQEVDFYADKSPSYDFGAQSNVALAILKVMGFGDDTANQVVNLMQSVTADSGTIGQMSGIATSKGLILVVLDYRQSVSDIIVNIKSQ